MKKICEKNKCTGCGACVNCCPVSAIHMEEDGFGEIHPAINENICIHCEKCIKTCPVNKRSERYKPLKCYAAWSRDMRYRTHCSSGGIATELSRFFVENNGVVFLARWNDDRNLAHQKIEKISDVYESKGSKYLQSNTGYTFRETKECLENSRLVLYVGTPCQIDGLKSYLGKEYKNLFTADLVCHGTPPNRYIKEYINHLENVYQEKITEVTFRDKYGFAFSAYTKYGLLYREFKDLYLQLFNQNVIYRESCYECEYANDARISDITLADFHGIGENVPFEGKRKVSLILVNSERGLKLIERCKERLILVERSIDEAINGNGQLRESSPRSPERNKFVENYREQGFVESAKKTDIYRECLRK